MQLSGLIAAEISDLSCVRARCHTGECGPPQRTPCCIPELLRAEPVPASLGWIPVQIQCSASKEAFPYMNASLANPVPTVHQRPC